MIFEQSNIYFFYHHCKKNVFTLLIVNFFTARRKEGVTQGQCPELRDIFQNKQSGSVPRVKRYIYKINTQGQCPELRDIFTK